MKRFVTGSTLVLLSFVCLTACRQSGSSEESENSTEVANAATISEQTFGTLPDGTTVSLYTMVNAQGMTMTVTNLGGTIVALKTPDKNGVFEDVVLGYDSIAGYIKAPSFFGALVGRYGNRIANGQFTLDGVTYDLAKNNGENHLHGGRKGFDKVVWNAAPVTVSDGVALKLDYLSKDMEEGYPGNLNVQVLYTLTNENELKIEYTATTDKKTIVNLTNHTYFNLSGNTKRDILDHVLSLNASAFIPVDETLIPTGEIKPVAGTPFDFTTPTVIGERIDNDDPQLKAGRGYDHCWVFNEDDGSNKPAATLYDPGTGRYMEMFTTEPGTQVYTGNFLNGSIVGKYGTTYAQRYAICLETQHFPDSPNQPNFPSVVLSPGETYHTETVYAFAVK
jgi:aldose 1-epimerase